MPSEIMDQRGTSASSRFYEEIHCTAERQIGVWKPNGMPDHQGCGGMLPTNSSKLDAPTSHEKLSPVYSGLSSSTLAIGPMEKQASGGGGFANLSRNSGTSLDSQPSLWSNFCMQSTSHGLNRKSDASDIGRESSLFSSSLSELFSRKLRLVRNDVLSPQPMNTVASNHEEVEPFESLEELEAQTIGNLLPDEDDLFSGVVGGAGKNSCASNGDDLEDLDLFSSGGGLELEGNGQGNCQRGSNGLFVGEQSHGKFPSRTLFVRNINSSVEDSELKALFEQYGEIQTLYTACKHRGFVMISYYDMRAAQTAMRSLQSKLLRHWKLDLHYFIPKENVSEDDINQGTLLVSNLDSSVSNDELHQIFGAYGEIKEIRDTKFKNHQKLVKFFDVRAAEAALCAMNGTEIAGEQIKLELIHLSGDFNSLSSANMASISPGLNACSSVDDGSNKILHNPVWSPLNSFTESHLSSSIPVGLSSSPRRMPIGKPIGIQEPYRFINQCTPNLHPDSFPEHHDGFANGCPYKTSRALAEMVGNGFKVNGGLNVGAIGGASNGHPLIGLSPSGNGSVVHGNHHMLNGKVRQHSPNPMIWPNSPSGINGPHGHRFSPVTAFPRPVSMMVKAAPSMHHHIGSAPTIDPAFWDRRHPYVAESPESSSFHMGSPSHSMDFAPHKIFAHVGGNNRMEASAAVSVGPRSPHNFIARSPIVSMPISFDSHSERVKSFSHRRSELSSMNADKNQFELEIDRILHGEDNRTALMIKNIPNKYTSKMLLAAIDEHCKGIYDFIYLPIDFKNKCNVGYAFINLIDPQKIIPFHKAFDGKKWEKFNSEKVASLAYARIQGKTALIGHFQNSSLMNEDKRCRPILFHTDGPNAGDQEPFPMGTNIRSRPGKPRTINNEENYGQGNSFSSSSANKVEFSNGADSASNDL